MVIKLFFGTLVFFSLLNAALVAQAVVVNVEPDPTFWHDPMRVFNSRHDIAAHTLNLNGTGITDAQFNAFFVELLCFINNNKV